MATKLASGKFGSVTGLKKAAGAGKPEYEAPCAVPLGEVSTIVAEDCKNGNQISGACETGGSPGDLGAECKNGSRPHQKCNTGGHWGS